MNQVSKPTQYIASLTRQLMLVRRLEDLERELHPIGFEVEALEGTRTEGAEAALCVRHVATA